MYRQTSGITLIEVLVATAIGISLLSLGMIMSLDSYKRYIFRDEQETLVNTLERARSHALNNISASPWGVCYESANKKYVIFKNKYKPGDLSNETVEANTNMTLSSVPTSGFDCSYTTPLIFSQITGTSTDLIIILTEDNKTSTTTINKEGMIDW